MNTDYHGRNVALVGMQEHADRDRRGEAVWRYCERRIVRIHASKNKRIETLKAHVLRVEKVCAQKNAYINELTARIGRREQTIRNKAELIDRQLAEIEELQKQNGELQTDLTTMNERYEAIEMEMAEVLQRAE